MTTPLLPPIKRTIELEFTHDFSTRGHLINAECERIIEFIEQQGDTWNYLEKATFIPITEQEVIDRIRPFT